MTSNPTKVTAKNTVISPNSLVWKFCGKAQFLCLSQNFHTRKLGDIMVFYAVSFIVIVDIEKEFDDLDHIFFILDLEKFRFWANDIAWVKT